MTGSLSNLLPSALFCLEIQLERKQRGGEEEEIQQNPIQFGNETGKIATSITVRLQEPRPQLLFLVLVFSS